jgi:serine/threonine protein phosphatase 1
VNRTIIIGDIHACHAELVELLDAVGLTPTDRLISVGDVVDRGPSPGEVVDLLRSRPNTVVVCGNHERKHVRGQQTPGLLGFGQEITRLQLGARYAEVVAWMATLPYSFEDDAVRVVHAGLIPGTPLGDTPADILSGTTSGEARLREQLGGVYWPELYTDDKVVVFGHHVVGPEALVVRDRVYGLDTGCCHGQFLTALILPERRLVSVRAHANHWKQTQQRWQLPVLASRPWAAWTFDQVAKKAAELTDRHPAAADWLASVVAWSEAVLGWVPALADAMDTRLAGVADAPRDLVGHPAHPTLVRYAQGKLSRTHLGCTSPAAVFALADALGVPVALPRSPPG